MKNARRWLAALLMVALLLTVVVAVSQSGEDIWTTEDMSTSFIHMDDEMFAPTLIEIVNHLEMYEGLEIQLEGQAHLYGDEYPDLPIVFAVLRPYRVDGELDSAGLDCYYEGVLPLDGDWVSVKGVLVSYQDGDGVLFPMLMVQSMESTDAREPIELTAEDLQHSH